MNKKVVGNPTTTPYNPNKINIVVDEFLDGTSTNPVQNKVITKALKDKVDKIEGFGLASICEVGEVVQWQGEKSWKTVLVLVEGKETEVVIPAYLSDLVDDIGLGDIDAALDSIIAIQNSLIGGDM